MATSLVERVRRFARKAAGRGPKTKRPASPFEKWTFDTASKAIDEAFASQTIDVAKSNQGPSVTPVTSSTPAFMSRQSSTNPIIVNRLFFQGDHWQNGDGWIGPHPEIGNPKFQESMNEIASIFTSKNAVKECTLRHALGVVGRNIQWGFTPVISADTPDGKPTEEVQQKIKEATALITPWLQKRKVPTLLRDAVCTLLLSERGGIQMVIPPGLADHDDQGNMVINVDTVAEALEFLFPEHPLPDNSAVIVDQDTKQEAGVWRYTMKDEEGDELSRGSNTITTSSEKEAEYVAMCYVDEANNTVIRIFRENEEEETAEAVLEMGGRTTMFEMRRTALITLQVQQAQRALNLAETMIPRTAITSGFLERTLIDAQLPGEPEVDAEGNETGRWIEKPFYVGAGTTNFIESSEYEDEEGKRKPKKANVKYREPISPEAAIKASDKHYRSILDDTSQLHVVMAGDSNPSGSSRLTARIEYLATLQLTQGEVEAAFRFIVDTALAMAEALAGKPGEFTKHIRTQCACRLDGGPLLPTERSAIEASIGKTISQETAMMLVGIEDVEAERARMAMDPMARTVYGEMVGKAISTLTSPGATMEGAARFIGIPDAQIAVLMSGDLGPNQTDNNQPVVTGTKDPKKPEAAPKPIARGPAKGGPEKKPLPEPATKVGIPGSR